MITSPSEGARRDPALGDDWLDLPRALGGNPSKNNEKKNLNGLASTLRRG